MPSVIYHVEVNIKGAAYITRQFINAAARILGPSTQHISASGFALPAGSPAIPKHVDAGGYIARTRWYISSSARIQTINNSVPKLGVAANIIALPGFMGIPVSAITIGSSTPLSSSRDALIYAGAVNPSSGNIAYDIIIGSVMDLLDADTPDAYHSYDWAYDWCTRQWNGCVVRFEARQSNDRMALISEPWSEITNGQILSHINIKQYHQWKMHLWASGAYDFELHQFTIKAFAQNPSSKYDLGVITRR